MNMNIIRLIDRYENTLIDRYNHTEIDEYDMSIVFLNFF